MGRRPNTEVAEVVVRLMPGLFIEAAGGVLWRPSAGGGIEVALVHRPQYDDWSLPKGKLTAGEHVVVGALREVLEETGHEAVVGRPLGETRYLKDGVPKRVRYWALRDAGGQFVPNPEVDQMTWLPPDEGRLQLAVDRDRSVLVKFAHEPVDTWPCVLMGQFGVEQAGALMPVVSAFGVRRVVSADVRCCLDTVRPIAKQAHVSVESEPLLSETGYDADPSAALERMLALLRSGEPSLVCTEGASLAGLVAELCTAFGHSAPEDAALRQAGIVVLHAARTEADQLRLVAVDRLDPPPLG